MSMEVDYGYIELLDRIYSQIQQPKRIKCNRLPKFKLSISSVGSRKILNISLDTKH